MEEVPQWGHGTCICLGTAQGVLAEHSTLKTQRTSESRPQQRLEDREGMDRPHRGAEHQLQAYPTLGLRGWSIVSGSMDPPLSIAQVESPGAPQISPKSCFQGTTQPVPALGS